MDHALKFTLSYTGNDADRHEIDFYDVSQALIGFQRSLALTTHLVVNDKIIVQAPSLKGARIYALPAEDGSWKITAGIIFTTAITGLYQLGTAPTNTPLGHVVHSVYDYVISESLGFHVDYEKSLGQLQEEYKEKQIEIPEIKQHQVDSLIEKCTTAVKDMHRPICKNESASNASITSNIGGYKMPIQANFSKETYDYIHEVYVSEELHVIEGQISSYNSNTFKGRIYIKDIGRPVSFNLTSEARHYDSVSMITNSLDANAVRRHKPELSTIYCHVYLNTSRSGYLKSVTITHVSLNDPR
ncbi:MAG: hypothetical protein V1706_06625 [Pseudomonadota bacterium]